MKTRICTSAECALAFSSVLRMGDRNEGVGCSAHSALANSSLAFWVACRRAASSSRHHKHLSNSKNSHAPRSSRRARNTLSYAVSISMQSAAAFTFRDRGPVYISKATLLHRLQHRHAHAIDSLSCRPVHPSIVAVIQ